MSEPAAKPRSPADYRDFDLGDMERRMRESLEPHQQPQSRENDPLAELARLVGTGEADPFRKLFAHRDPEPGAQPATVHQLRPYEAPRGNEQDHYYEQGHQQPAAHDPYAQAHYPQDPYAQDPYAQHDPAQHGYAEQPAYRDPRYDQQAYDQAHGAQAYAHDQDSPWAPENDYQNQYDDYVEEKPRRSGRAKLLIGAALLVVAGGVGATYFTRTSALTGEPPTILAAAGPVKVQPAQPEAKTSEQSISVLERGGPASTETKTVQSGEQPLDLAQATKGQGASKPSRSADTGAPVTLAPPPPPPVANSLFAEPKRVKAVQVRPDGSIVEALAPASIPPQASRPEPAARPTDMASLVEATKAPSTTPSSVKAPVRVETRTAPASATPVAAKPAPAATPAAAPVQLATAGGGFAVQLAGTTSEEEAKDALSRLGRKFSAELGGLRPAIVRADVGSKTVYRVRVTNLSSDDANTLCARLKASGGSCFVAKN